MKSRKPLACSSHNTPDIQSLVFEEMNYQIFISFSSTTWHILSKCTLLSVLLALIDVSSMLDILLEHFCLHYLCIS